MPVHTVKQGDSMTSIADQYERFWETIWNHENNAGLREKRQNPNILMAGDVVFIPDLRQKEESCVTTNVHTFWLKTVPARLNLRILDAAGRPRAGVGYKLDVDGQKFSGSTDDDGRLSHVIRPGAKKARLKLASGEEWDLDIGHVNPIDYASGIQARLKNLGYYRGAISGSIDEETKEAIRDFQQANGLEETGEADGATREALIAGHAS